MWLDVSITRRCHWGQQGKLMGIVLSLSFQWNWGEVCCSDVGRRVVAVSAGRDSARLPGFPSRRGHEPARYGVHTQLPAVVGVPPGTTREVSPLLVRIVCSCFWIFAFVNRVWTYFLGLSSFLSYAANRHRARVWMVLDSVLGGLSCSSSLRSPAGLWRPRGSRTQTPWCSGWTEALAAARSMASCRRTDRFTWGWDPVCSKCE